ncbi:MAG: DUF72 domain-containing protein [Spirochaetota bacterium]
MKIYTGTSGYSYKEWKGYFYPEKISADKMLPYYSSKLTAVEINNTYYRMPKMSVVETWAGEVPSDFMFAVKAPQIITHIKRLKNVSEETRYFLTVISGLGKKLGTILFQFPASFKQDIPLLENFLKRIPPGINCTFDFRSTTWFNDETYKLLGQRDFSLCLEDTDEKPVTDIISTATWGYLRLRRSNYTDADLSDWAKKILSIKWKKVFVFFKHEGDEAKGPSLAVNFCNLFDTE